MQTNLIEEYRRSLFGPEAEAILRSCMHCGFCTATCPTYQLLGDELDGPRGRIYLIKQLLEGGVATRRTQQHLDRCLTCRACETTCPSGVRYGRLVDIGRELIEQRAPRPALQRLQRWLLRKVLPYPQRFAPLLFLGQSLRPLLPRVLRHKVPMRQRVDREPAARETPPPSRRMLVLQGCAQSATTPQTNVAATQVLAAWGIELVSAPAAGCCGAVSQHLAAADEAKDFMRRNIDAWWPYIEQGVEAVVITASGCGVMLKEYGELLQQDPIYADKARRVSALARDLSEVIAKEDLSMIKPRTTFKQIAFHSPCTLQHGQQLNGLVERILQQLGYTLVEVEDAHLCCGSAGTYSILQAQLSQQLLSNKLVALQQGQPELIATANVGCQLHLATRAGVPVKHWIELLL
ncbi:MAG: glycolate oxidase subunit GlcF [Gammaproteobacteria bacterium]